MRMLEIWNLLPRECEYPQRTLADCTEMAQAFKQPIPVCIMTPWVLMNGGCDLLSTGGCGWDQKKNLTSPPPPGAYLKGSWRFEIWFRIRFMCTDGSKKNRKINFLDLQFIEQMFFEQLSTFAIDWRSLKIVGVKNFGFRSKKCVFRPFFRYLGCAGLWNPVHRPV